MIDEKQKKDSPDVLAFACGLATCIIFLQYAKRGKMLVQRKKLKKNRRYIRLSRLYHRHMRKYDGILFCKACWDLVSLEMWDKFNVKVNFIPKRFKRRVLPWRLIRRKK